VGFYDRGNVVVPVSETRQVAVEGGLESRANVKSPWGRRSGDPGDHSSRAGTEIQVCCRKFGFFSPFDLLHVLSTPTIFPMMPDRVDTPILTITR
jgi:hypothetical protein